MRVLQVTTLVSPDGAYGGPVRVAINQCQALREIGLEAEIATSWRGYARRPASSDGVVLHARRARGVLPGIGYAGLCSPALLTWAVGHLASYDVVHVHLARDLVTLPMAALALAMGKPLVVQTHGMVDPSDRALARPLDALITRRALRRARAVLFLTETEKAGLVSVAGEALQLRQLHNGVPTSRVTSERTNPPLVLFMARLHARKRPCVFVQAALELLAAGIDADFVLVGPDEGEADRVVSLIQDSGTSRVAWRGPLAHDDAMTTLASAALQVLPSVDEPYPMGVLESMAHGVPVLVTQTCGLAREVAEEDCGAVVGEGTHALASAIRTFLSDDASAQRMSGNARRASRELHDMSEVARRLTGVYEAAVEGRGDKA